jgi:tRNA pseudouridine38-40 synthase
VVQIVCSKEMQGDKLRLGLNAKLPPDIRVLAVERVDSEFHPTLHSYAKTYWYYIDTGPGQNPFYRRFAWHYPYAIDLEKMRLAANKMVGERDFSAFTTLKTKEETTRTLESLEVVQLEPHLLRIELTGNRFLYKMARTIAGTLADIGSGKVDGEVLDTLFQGAGRSAAGVTAPAHGLTLQKIHYVL